MNRILALAAFWILPLALQSCSSKPPAPEPVKSVAAGIDYDELQNKLGLDLAPGETGFREAKFDACPLGDALHELKEPLTDCHQAYFTLIQYQLSCRAELQPEAVLTESDLTPVRNQTLRYTMDHLTGPTVTNHRGEGVIRLITRNSRKRTHLKISNGTDFMIVRANEINAIVTPPEWCSK